MDETAIWADMVSDTTVNAKGAKKNSQDMKKSES